MNTSDPVHTVLARLDGVRQTGPARWQARCPAHEDKHPSLSIGQGDDYRALVYCHAGCAVGDVLKAVGLSDGDLFPPDPAGKPVPRLPKLPKGGAAAGRQIVTSYNYTDVDDKLLFQVVRYEPKDFKQRRPDGNGGWIWKLGDVPRVLYRLPELLAADGAGWVFIVEGEKDADNVAALGLVATTNVGGAGKWKHLAELIQRHGGSITARDLMRSSRAYPNAEIADQALDGLAEAGVGRWEDAGPTAGGGRPTHRFVLADAVDVDTTQNTSEKSWVSSTEPVKAAVPPVAAPTAIKPPLVDKTPELPKESEVLSTSAPSTPARPQRAVALDPDRPGPTDLLSEAQYRRYRTVYDAHRGEPGEKHAAAWRAAVAEGKE